MVNFDVGRGIELLVWVEVEGVALPNLCFFLLLACELKHLFVEAVAWRPMYVDISSVKKLLGC